MKTWCLNYFFHFGPGWIHFLLRCWHWPTIDGGPVGVLSWSQLIFVYIVTMAGWNCFVNGCGSVTWAKSNLKDDALGAWVALIPQGGVIAPSDRVNRVRNDALRRQESVGAVAG